MTTTTTTTTLVNRTKTPTTMTIKYTRSVTIMAMAVAGVILSSLTRIPMTIAFSTVGSSVIRSQGRPTTTARNVLPITPAGWDHVAAASVMSQAADVMHSLSPSSSHSALSNSVHAVMESNGLWLSKIDEGDMGQIVKTTFIVLLFGGGLIPAAIVANKAMIDTLTKKRPEKKVLTDEQKRTNLDPTFGQADYVESSGASGPSLPVTPLLFAPESIPLADIAAIVGRIPDVNSVADWKNLPSTRIDNAIDPNNPPMWLPRATFKANVRRAKFTGWPTDSSGRPIGGEALRDAELGRVSKSGAAIGDAALDAVFDTWAWGANIATPDKVGRALRGWKDEEGGFSLTKFQLSAVGGRAVTGVGALTFVVLQVVAYGSLFIAPLLRTFFDVDIGLGTLGTCDPETCIRLFQ